MKVQLIIGLLIFVLMTGICSADDYVGGIPLTTIKEGVVSGGVYFDSLYGAAGQVGEEPITLTKTFTIPSYTDIDWAMLLTTAYCGHMENDKPGWANVTFNDHVLGNESLNVSFAFKSCGTGGVGYTIVNDHVNRVSSDYLMWYNVTDKILPSNTAIVHTENQSGSTYDGRVKLIALIVAYNDTTSGKTIYYWVNRGHDVDTKSHDDYCAPPYYIGNTSFAASLTGVTIGDADLTAVYMASTDGLYTFNSNNINNLTGPTGTYSGSNSWDVTSTFNPSGNNIITYDRSEEYYKIPLAILTAEKQENKPDLEVTEINAFHNIVFMKTFFNLSNEVNVTVKNTGNATSDPSKVSLYEDSELIGKMDIPSLNSDESTTVQFMWTPTGTDCEDSGSPYTYTLTAVADCDGVINEWDEGNNDSAISEPVYWIGWSADEHLNTVFHGTIQGGLYYTTGDGVYVSELYDGQSQITNYPDISTSIPSGAEIELARLNVYYTWSRNGQSSTGFYPSMNISITNSTDTYFVESDEEYNDRPCSGVTRNLPYGNYVYDITDYVKAGDNSIQVNVTNVGSPGDNFCPAAPGIVIVYEDNTMPTYDYWIVEGADILEGGLRAGAGALDLNECIANATFTGSVNTGIVENATLGIVAGWAGGDTGAYSSCYWFNDNLIGYDDILGGWGGSSYFRTVCDMSMRVGSGAQLGVNVSDVTGLVVSQDNKVSFGDDGDSMMAANAFLLVGTGEQTGLCGDVNNDGEVDMGDVNTLWYDIANYPSPGAYTISNEWAADVNCDGEIDMGDVNTLWYDIANYPSPGDYEINCC